MRKRNITPDRLDRKREFTKTTNFSFKPNLSKKSLELAKSRN